MLEAAEDGLRAQVSPFGGGLDWLELRVPTYLRWRPGVEEIVSQARSKPGEFRGSAQYRTLVDLRKYGLADAMLHVDQRHSENPHHKVQMIGAGQYSMSQHLGELERILDTNPLNLEPMRVDTMVDIPGVPVAWVLEHASVQHKRFQAQVGKGEYMAVGRRKVETIYSGKKPNCFRVYDKTAERISAYQAFSRGWHPPEPEYKTFLAKTFEQNPRPDSPAVFEAVEKYCARFGLLPNYGQSPLFGGEAQQKLELPDEQRREMFDAVYTAWMRKVEAKGPKPTFRQFCGMDESQVLTRFERQIGAQQSKHLADKSGQALFGSLRDLRKNLPDWNPFASVSFSTPGMQEPALPNGVNYSPLQYMAGLYYRERVRREGRQLAEAWIRSMAKGDAKRLLKRLVPFAPPEALEAVPISESGLYERYREAVTRQLAA